MNASDDEENWDEVMFYLQEYSTSKLPLNGTRFRTDFNAYLIFIICLERTKMTTMRMMTQMRVMLKRELQDDSVQRRRG
jgi:hypothetical protein